MEDLEKEICYQLFIGVEKRIFPSVEQRFHFTFKIPDGRLLINDASARTIDDIAYTVSKQTKREDQTHKVRVTFSADDIDYGPLTEEQKQEFINRIEYYKVKYEYPELKLLLTNHLG